jgi:hypothetical protein
MALVRPFEKGGVRLRMKLGITGAHFVGLDGVPGYSRADTPLER